MNEPENIAPDQRPSAAVITALDTVDWRTRTFDLYRRVRATPDPQTAHRLWQDARNEMFAHHPASPLLPADADGFVGLPVAEYDPQWRFEVRIDEAPPRRLSLETGTDGIVDFDRLGLVRIPGVGTLDVWRHLGYAGGLFIPVKDAGSGQTSYGGGRYLIDTIKGADLGWNGTEITLDFNFAYNPSCAYDPAWACPLAQAGNTVEGVIPVGEADPAAKR